MSQGECGYGGQMVFTGGTIIPVLSRVSPSQSQGPVQKSELRTVQGFMLTPTPCCCPLEALVVYGRRMTKQGCVSGALYPQEASSRSGAREGACLQVCYFSLAAYQLPNNISCAQPSESRALGERQTEAWLSNTLMQSSYRQYCFFRSCRNETVPTYRCARLENPLQTRQ